MKLAFVLAWLRQTSTIAGFAIFAGVGADVLTHSTVYAAAAAGLVAVLMPGHPEVKGQIAQLSADVSDAVAAKGSVAALGPIALDLVKLSHELPLGTQVVPVAPVVAQTFQIVKPTV